MNNPFARWLEWLDSHDGRLFRRSQGKQETDLDIVCTLPPDGAVITVGILREFVNKIVEES